MEAAGVTGPEHLHSHNSQKLATKTSVPKYTPALEDAGATGPEHLHSHNSQKLATKTSVPKYTPALAGSAGCTTNPEYLPSLSQLSKLGTKTSVPKYTPALGGWAGSGGRIHPEFLHLTYTLSQNSQNLQQNKLNKNLPSHSSPFPGRGGTTDPEYRIPPLSKHATEQVDLKSAIMQYTPPGAIGG